jgi:hypothetical protein
MQSFNNVVSVSKYIKILLDYFKMLTFFSCSKIPRKRSNWTDEDMKKALEMVREYQTSHQKASEETGVPRSTIQKYIARDLQNKQKQGAPTVLTTEEENDLVNWIIESSRRGYCPR